MTKEVLFDFWAKVSKMCYIKECPPKYNVKKWMLKEIEHPKWDAALRTHDWRNYISYDIREAWPNLSLETKTVVYRVAQEVADDEDWD